MASMFKIHSTVDLITNSSTTIYTYQDCSISSAKELLSEILKVFGVDKSVDDLFVVTALLDEEYEYFEDDSEDIPSFTQEESEALIENIKTGLIEKPEWMKKIEEETNWSGYQRPISLYIHAKDSEYNGIANKLIGFLNSPSAEAFRDG